jgi:hypothetical protein
MSYSKLKKRLSAKPISKYFPLSKNYTVFFILIFTSIATIILIKSFASNPNLLGDLNNDNIVNVSDLSMLLSKYGSNDATADINSDGTVNIADLSILLSNYGKTYSGSDSTAPAAPSGLSVSSTSATSIGLKWNDSTEPDFAYYAVRRATQSDPTSGTWVRLPGNLTSSQVTDSDSALVAGTTYYYYVTAVDSSGNVSAKSSVVSGALQNGGNPVPPPPPPSGSCTPSTNGTINSADRIWYPAARIQSAALGDLPDTYGNNNPYGSLQRKGHPVDINAFNNPNGLTYPNGQVIKGVRLGISNQDSNVAGSTNLRARAAYTSPTNLYQKGQHVYFGMGVYATNDLPLAGAIFTWYGSPASAGGPMTIYGESASKAGYVEIRMTRNADKKQTDINNKVTYYRPWVIDVPVNHTYAFVVDVHLSSDYNPNNLSNAYGGSFAIYMSVDGCPYQKSPSIWGDETVPTQTMNDGVLNNFYLKPGSMYAGVDLLTSNHVFSWFFPGNMGKTFGAADPLERYAVQP